MTTTAPVVVPARLRAEASQPIGLVRPGRLEYREAWELQKRLVERRRNGDIPDLLLLLEHPPVYTCGKRTDPSHILLDAPARAARGIDLVQVDRGGDVTYHGPGQLVGYPILGLASLRHVVGYVRTLEDVLIRALAEYGVDAVRDPQFTGVWVGERKIAAIGVRVASGGVTSHGFALNVNPDMTAFDGIIPCGIADRGVCSLAGLGIDTDVEDVTERVAEAAGEVLGATLQAVPLDDVDPDRRPIT